MRESAPQPKKESSPWTLTPGADTHEHAFALDMLRDTRTLLRERMRESGHTYEIEETQQSFSLQADAENFAPMLAYVESLLAAANARADSQNRTHHLGVVVRGMHRVDIITSRVRGAGERK
jgi:hypothetical protein